MNIFSNLRHSSKIYKKEISKKKRLKNSDPKSYWNLLKKYSGEKKNILHKISCEVFHDHFSKLNNLQDQNEGQFEEIILDLVRNYNE